MASSRYIFGFHAVLGRLKRGAAGIHELHLDPERNDARARDLLARAKEIGVRVLHSDALRLDGMAGGARHQGVVALADAPVLSHSLDDILDGLQEAPLILVLDGVTDPHNLGACLRTADAAGVHAVVAPKDRAVGLNSTVMKVASGAAETMPYITVTNLARTLKEMQERDIWVVGAADEVKEPVHAPGLNRALALVLGAEGEGLRRLTRETCDELRVIPMMGSVESLNVSVAAGVCLFEARRQRNA